MKLVVPLLCAITLSTLAPNALAGGATEDSDAPSRAPTAAERMYMPSVEETARYAPPPPPSPWVASALLDFHAFQASTGTVRGTALELRGRIGGAIHGLTVGTFEGKHYGLGYDVFRYAGVTLPGVEISRGWRTIVLFPNLDARMYFGGEVKAAFALGSSLTGLRVANCNYEMSLRVPTASVWVVGDSSDKSGTTASLGASFSAALLF